MRLPQALEPAFFDEVFRTDHATWRAAVVEVCAAHCVECDVVSAFADGSNLVAAVDDHWIVKIFPPFHRHQWESERRVLAHLRGETLPLKVPLLIADGIRDDGWPYVIMEKLPGVALATCWDDLGTQDRTSIIEKIGSAMAAVHRLPLGEAATLAPEWRSFLRNQTVDCRKRHAAFGVPEWFHEGLDGLLGEWAPDNDTDDRLLLTAEYMPFNLLVQRDASVWRLTGMIDYTSPGNSAS